MKKKPEIKKPHASHEFTFSFRLAKNNIVSPSKRTSSTVNAPKAQRIKVVEKHHLPPVKPVYQRPVSLFPEYNERSRMYYSDCEFSTIRAGSTLSTVASEFAPVASPLTSYELGVLHDLLF